MVVSVVAVIGALGVVLGIGALALVRRPSTSSSSTSSSSTSSSSTSSSSTEWQGVPVANDATEAYQRIIPSPDAPWIPVALQEFGTAEVRGGENARIVEYHRSVDDTVSEDEVPWCASFVGWVLGRFGIKGTGSRLARSYLSWGAPSRPRFGAIVVMRRGTSSTSGHVGFLVASSPDHAIIYVLGGNQGDKVSIAAFDAGTVLGYRWPSR